jgi:hypothetical protein
VGAALDFVEAEGDLDLGRGRLYGAAESLLDRDQAAAHGGTADAKRGGGRGEVSGGGEVGAKGLSGAGAAVAIGLERVEVVPAQRGGEQVVGDDGRQQGDVGVVDEGSGSALGDRQGGGCLAVAEAPAGETPSRYAAGKRHSLRPREGGDEVELLGLEAATAPDPGPGRLLVGLDQEEATVEALAEAGERLGRCGAGGDDRDVVGVELVVELAGDTAARSGGVRSCGDR